MDQHWSDAHNFDGDGDGMAKTTTAGEMWTTIWVDTADNGVNAAGTGNRRVTVYAELS